MITGLDVSHHQAHTPPLAGQSFLIARATIGTQPDDMYSVHIRNARDAGVLVGAYHFNWDTLPIKDQVDAFLAKAGDVDMYALDVEGERAFSHAQSHEFIQRVQAAGKRCGLYHSLSGYFDAGQDWRWIAAWGFDSLPIAYDIWQFGAINGIDGNRFDGTVAQMRDRLGIGGNGLGAVFNAARWTVKAGTPFFEGPNGKRIGTLPNPVTITTVGPSLSTADPDGTDFQWFLGFLTTSVVTGSLNDKFVWFKRSDLTQIATVPEWDASIAKLLRDPDGRYPAAPQPPDPAVIAAARTDGFNAAKARAIDIINALVEP